MSRAQWTFTVALVAVSILIVWFSVFVVRSTVWGDRWYRKER